MSAGIIDPVELKAEKIAAFFLKNLCKGKFQQLW